MFNLPLLTLDKKKLTAAASTTFTLADYVIPSGTRHLAILFNGALTTAAGNLLVRFNNDSGTNYNLQTIQGAASTASAARTTGGTSIAAFGLPTGANLFGGGMILIPHYANTANHKAVLTIGAEIENNVMGHAGRWANTAAITSVTLLASANNIAADSIAILCAVDERFVIEEQNLSSDGTVTFSSGLPTLDEDLVCVGYCRTDRVAASDSTIVTINGDTTDANYGRQMLFAGDTAITSSAGADRESVRAMPGSSAAGNVFGAFVWTAIQPFNGVEQPHLISVSGFHEGTGPTSDVAIVSARRANVGAYTSIKFAPGAGTNYKSGSLFSLYRVPKRLVSFTKLAADAASATHTVPAGYEAIIQTVYARSDVVAATDSVALAFNNDTAAGNYDKQLLTGDGATAAASQSATSRTVSNVPGASAGANIFAGFIALVIGYGESDRHKHMLALGGAADDIVTLASHRWENTAAITEIDWTPNNGSNFEG